MSKEEIKQKIHQLIDEIVDEEMLNILHEDVAGYKNISTAPVNDELSEEQWASVMKGVTQAEKGEPISHEQVIQKISEWQSTK